MSIVDRETDLTFAQLADKHGISGREAKAIAALVNFTTASYILQVPQDMLTDAVSSIMWAIAPDDAGSEKRMKLLHAYEEVLTKAGKKIDVQVEKVFMAPGGHA